MTTAFEHIDPADKKLPYETAIEVLDLADKNEWEYAPMLDGCYNRKDMETHLKDNPDAAIAVVVSYDPDCADSVDVSLINGMLTLELEDNFYYSYKHVKSVSEIESTVMTMLKEYHSQSDAEDDEQKPTEKGETISSALNKQDTNLLRVTEKKKNLAIETGHELVGFVVKKGDNFRVIADGRARNISKKEYRTLMQYPD